MSINPYVNLVIVALLVNIPLGVFRSYEPKFSLKWLFWIHASIPLIIFLRVSLGVSSWVIPAIIFTAVLGQIWGGRWGNKSMTEEEKVQLMQIPLKVSSNRHLVKESDVMVALLNMGGPKINADVKDFLMRVFSDSRLIRFPMSWAFQKLFAQLLVTFRSKHAAKRYELIGGGSPILESTQDQTRALQKELKKRGRAIQLTFSFNYSSPLPDETIQEVKDAGKKYILPISLYPHYSSATTGSNLHYLKKAAKEIYPELIFLDAPSYYLHEQYIRAFVDRIREQAQPHESLDDFYLLFSAHGLPLYFLKEGDPYPFQISQTVAKVLAQLGRDQQWAISYQSAVGPMQWIKPSTEDMLSALAKRNVKKMIIIPISFVTDHIETTVEIDMEYRQIAESLGISDFRMSKAIECHPGFIHALADAVESVFQNSENMQNNAHSAAPQVSSNV